MTERETRGGIDQQKALLNKERERFSGALVRQVITGLEKDPETFDFLQGDTSPETMRKLQEAIELAERENKELAEKLKDIKREVYTGLESKETPKWLENFSEEQRIVLARNLDHIELTQGCSLACPHCGIEAKPGVRGYLAFGDLIYLAKNYGKYCKKPPLLYFASEPLDWEEGSRTYLDVHEMVVFFIGRPFTSTAYPKGKEMVFAKALESGRLDRVSISANNAARLLKDGWVRQGINSRGETTLVSDNPVLQKILDEESTYIDPEMLTRLRIGRFYDESRKGVEEAPTGGLERENEVILRTDGFHNLVICEPTRDSRSGIIIKRIDPEKINQPIDLDHLPETIDELMDYGIVNKHEEESIYYHETFRRAKGFSLILSNFSGSKEKRFYAEYNLKDHKIISIDEIKDDEKAEFDFFIDISRQRTQMAEMMEEGINFRYLMVGVAPSHIKLEELNKNRQFYKKALGLLKPVFDRFKKIGGEINFKDYPFLVYRNGFADEDGADSRKDILLKDLTALNNIFILMREIYSDVSDEDLQKSRNDAFDKFFQGIRNILLRYVRGSALTESLEFIESLREKYLGE